MTKFLNISTDNTLGGASPSNETVSSQKAIKEYVDSQTGTAPAFANITGQPTDNTNLASALNAKYDASNPDGFINNTNDCVHISGTETITGFKTLSAGAKITTTQSGAILELESAAAGTNFLLKRTNGATCVVESGNYIGLLGTYSNHPFQIRTNYVNRMEFGTNGSVTLATAPNENSNDNQVATTAWTNSKIPTVNNATLTIQKNGTDVATFTANSSTNQTANITVPTDTGDLTNGAGFITGITSGDVTTALGYTPYDASNPNGYTSNVGTVTSVNNVSPVSGNVTLSIPTVNDSTITITQGGVTKGSFTLNQSSGDTIALDAGGSSYTAGDGIDITSNVISNTGVRSISTGTNNGTISVDTNGTSAEVAVAGLGSAAYTSSTDYLTPSDVTSSYSSTGTDPVNGTAVASAISDKADTSLSNLTSTGKNIGNWSSNLTNCITYIPQDIKLELDSGTLTLKAGSKCYLKTDTTTPSVSIGTDLTTTQTTNGTYFAIYNGSSLTTVLTTAYNYSTLPNTYSYPLALVTVSGNSISSIDQVFNGFGYIGSTVFALPGVKGLVPNGRNEDGTLKSSEFSLTGVLTFTNSTGSAPYRDAIIDIAGTNPRLSRSILYYDKYMNFNHNTTLSGDIVKQLSIGDMQLNNGVITSFSLKTAFQTLDYNDKPIVSGWAMPSDKSIDLTLGASGTNYTAPANGWFYIAKTAGTANAYITVTSLKGYAVSLCSPTTTFNMKIIIPAKRGDTVQVSYNATGSTNAFKFFYAQGEV